jgi:cation transport ATPase
MNISRNVIIDLLPLYLAEEASEDTRQLVEAYLATDPSIKKWVEQAQNPQLFEEIPSALNKEHELKTLEKVKRYTQQRNLFMSMSFLFTGLLLAFRFDGNDITWFWNGTSAALPIFVLAFFSWIMFAHSVRKLSLENIQEMRVQQNVFLGLAAICSLLFALLLAFTNLGPINSDILYFLLFFAFVGWIGFANAVRQLSK